jgi:TRAP-type C4-dicarboxylate transport system permease small subunit
MGEVEVDILSELKTPGSNVKIFELGKFVGSGASLVLVIAAVACFAYMVWGGFNWVMSGGDKGKVDSARQMITNAAIGLGITASVFAAFRIVQWFLGIAVV